MRPETKIEALREFSAHASRQTLRSRVSGEVQAHLLSFRTKASLHESTQQLTSLARTTDRALPHRFLVLFVRQCILTGRTTIHEIQKMNQLNSP